MRTGLTSDGTLRDASYMDLPSTATVTPARSWSLYHPCQGSLGQGLYPARLRGDDWQRRRFPLGAHFDAPFPRPTTSPVAFISAPFPNHQKCGHSFVAIVTTGGSRGDWGDVSSRQCHWAGKTI